MVWECRCDCGNVALVSSRALLSGNTKSCGCLRGRKTAVGEKYGRLTVVADSGRRERYEIIWQCICECGASSLTAGSHLRSGHTRSCGCLAREQASNRRATHRLSGTPTVWMRAHAKRRAARLGVPFALTVEDIQIPAVCPALGIPIIKGDKVLHDGSPTLDRLRPELGYVRGNVVVISHLANSIKQNCTSVQVRAVGEWMRAHGL